MSMDLQYMDPIRSLDLLTQSGLDSTNYLSNFVMDVNGDYHSSRHGCFNSVMPAATTSLIQSNYHESALSNVINNMQCVNYSTNCDTAISDHIDYRDVINANECDNNDDVHIINRPSPNYGGEEQMMEARLASLEAYLGILDEDEDNKCNMTISNIIQTNKSDHHSYRINANEVHTSTNNNIKCTSGSLDAVPRRISGGVPVEYDQMHQLVPGSRPCCGRGLLPPLTSHAPPPYHVKKKQKQKHENPVAMPCSQVSTLSQSDLHQEPISGGIARKKRRKGKIKAGGSSVMCGGVNNQNGCVVVSRKRAAQSRAAAARRKRIGEKLRELRELVPGGRRVGVDLATMLEKAATYVSFMRVQHLCLLTEQQLLLTDGGDAGLPAAAGAGILLKQQNRALRPALTNATPAASFPAAAVELLCHLASSHLLQERLAQAGLCLLTLHHANFHVPNTRRLRIVNPNPNPANHPTDNPDLNHDPSNLRISDRLITLTRDNRRASYSINADYSYPNPKINLLST